MALQWLAGAGDALSSAIAGLTEQQAPSASTPSPRPPYPCFGVALETSLANADHFGTIHFLWRALDVVDEHLDVEGIFRLSGSHGNIQQIKASCDRTGGFDADAYSVHDVCSAVKLFLRELPAACLDDSDSLYASWLEIARLGEADALQNTRALLLLIPEDRRNVLCRLLTTLHRINAHSAQNRMPASNLAVVFSPCLMRTADVLTEMSNLGRSVQLTTFLITHGHDIWAD